MSVEPSAAGRFAVRAGLFGLLAVSVACAAEPAEGGANLFAGGIGNAIVTLIIFGTVVAVLGRYAWPRLLRVLDERERAIRQSLEDARRERQQAQQLLAEYQRQLEQARAQASAIVEEGRRDAEEVRRRIQQEARAEADAMITRARREIRLATDAAVKELYDRSADLAIEIARNILRREVDAEMHRELIAESLERIRAAGAQVR